eukprot:gnl/TRDRNA2_/TRDRNA2_175087_c2_seq1.p1 gnl/TRDRNA2_/TRDRNA2_175087_c2~~gnl/TRDRNA2_/TRDRNA2_175087_c2_seq1.p1  ORF type:complete len:316 (+),score=58.68 gnl/TRDRNA2_/TRDRNA2_175087_c2_seq1:62-1009(+)
MSCLDPQFEVAATDPIFQADQKPLVQAEEDGEGGGDSDASTCASTPAHLAVEVNPEMAMDNCNVAECTSVIPSPCNEPVQRKGVNVVFFDWDDTLLPTWHIVAIMRHRDLEPVTESSPHYEGLKAHAELVKNMLRCARAVAKVAILTSAQRPWVVNSSEKYLPGLEVSDLLEELDIPVYYASEHLSKMDAKYVNGEGGQDLYTAAKAWAVRRALKKIRGPCRTVDNVLSIGDSVHEQDAVKEVLWTDSAHSPPIREMVPPRCKTVKLMDNPSLEDLGLELQCLSSWLQSMLAHEDDFDYTMSAAVLKAANSEWSP